MRRDSDRITHRALQQSTLVMQGHFHLQAMAHLRFHFLNDPTVANFRRSQLPAAIVNRPYAATAPTTELFLGPPVESGKRMPSCIVHSEVGCAMLVSKTLRRRQIGHRRLLDPEWKSKASEVCVSLGTIIISTATVLVSFGYVEHVGVGIVQSTGGTRLRSGYVAAALPDTNCPHAITPRPPCDPPRNVRPFPPPLGGGGSPSDGPPQPQFQCHPKKNFPRRVGDYKKGGGGTRLETAQLGGFQGTH